MGFGNGEARWISDGKVGFGNGEARWIDDGKVAMVRNAKGMRLSVLGMGIL